MAGLRRQGYAVLAGSIFIASCGMAYSWLSPVLSKLTDPNGEIRASDEQVSWMAVLIEAGSLFSPFFASYLMERFGRKLPMLLCVPPMVLSWILTLTTRSVTLLYIKRLIEGMVIGTIATAAPVYLAEISTATTRGAMMISIIVSWNVGSLLQFCIGTFLSYNTTAWVNIIIPIFYFIIFSFLPESPYYLMMKHREAKAAKALAWFRDVHPNQVSEELTQIQEYLEKDMQNKESLTHVLKNVTYRKCFCIMIVVTLGVTMTGLNTIFSYATVIFADAGNDGIFNADSCSLIVVFLILILSIISSLVIDKVGRRPLALLSGFGCFLSHIGSTLYFYFKDDININWLPLITIGSYCFFVSIGLNPTLMAYQGELFPSSVKSVASGVTVLMSTCISIFAVKLYYIINVTYGMYMNYFIYAFMAGFCTIWLYFYAPETKNKTFNELYDELRGGKKTKLITIPEELQTFKEKT